VTAVLPAILEIENLRIRIRHGEVDVTPVTDATFHVSVGETLGLVGESGCGKSLTLSAIVGLLPAGAYVESGTVLADLEGAGSLSGYEPEAVRGTGVGMVFQEPMSALNPTMRVGSLIAEGARVGLGLDRAAALRRAVDLMREVGIPDPERRARSWPHQLSGGLRQRVMIAMALSAEPRLLLCDEPTTALDTTIQDQILGLLQRIQEERHLSVVFVTHDLAVIGQIASRVAVMYAGQVVETGTVEEVFTLPQHPYTMMLLKSVPSVHRPGSGFASIEGRPPSPTAFPAGCRFHPRCPLVQQDCSEAEFFLSRDDAGRSTACIHPDLIAGSDRS
jgi:oligopeptide/dipeptide ABC transporter ATP-binding protein